MIMRAAFLCSALILSANALGATSQLSPAASHKELHQPTQSESKSTYDDRSSEAERERLKQEGDEKARNDAELVRLTGELAVGTTWLAFFTCLLVLVTSGQLYMFWHQLRLTRDAVKDGSLAANAAVKSANAATAALTELERPWIFVQGTHIRRRDEYGNDLTPNNFFISFLCKNVGRAPATIEECIIKFTNKSSISELPDYADAILIQCPEHASVGDDFETHPIGPTPETGIDPNMATTYVAFGRLIYKELNGRSHTSRFAVEISPMMAACSTYGGDAYNGYD